MRGRLLFALPLVLLIADVAMAQSIRGQVIVPSTRANERIEVTLEKNGGQVVARSYSDTSGNFFFYSVPAASDYFVVVKLDGYENAKEPVYFSPAGTTVLKISLTKKELPTTRDNAGPVSLAELNQKYPKRVTEEFEKALEESRNGNSQEAANRIEGVLKQAPDFFQAHNALGTIYQKLERFTDAEREYSTARSLNPQFSLPLVNLGSLYLRLAEVQNKEGPRVVGPLLQKALTVLREAVRLDSFSALGFSLLGMASYEFGQYEEAEQSLKQALELQPGMPSARLSLLNLNVRLQKWQAALDQVDAYLRENPAAADAEQIRAVRTKVQQNLERTSR